MAVNYDFDLLSIAAKAFSSKALTEAGAGQPPMALFRDPATVAALERAPQSVQDYLCACNFGINCYHSGAPAGRYPDVDDAARITVIEALAVNVGKFDLPRPDDSQPSGDEFHLPAFFAAVAEAEPIRMETAPAFAAPLPQPDAIIADAMAADAITVDAVAADAIAADDLIADAVAAHIADADLAAIPPEALRRFHLPTLPRWLTAGAALAVLGVAFGTAML